MNGDSKTIPIQYPMDNLNLGDRTRPKNLGGGDADRCQIEQCVEEIIQAKFFLFATIVPAVTCIIRQVCAKYWQ
ncbi:hypothetical protein SNEBB_008553 [Seison nebaliae]|nr:hypothetical protein SNEBB_008553 [Seison nebaliae]